MDTIYQFFKNNVNEISAIANIITALGVLVALYTLSVQKRIHQIDLHTKFQNAIRSIQDKLPPDINYRIARLSALEQRVVTMYWYAVFDEWFTCKKKSKLPELNKIWESFAWGAKSAIDHLPIFAREFVIFRRSGPYLLGTHDEFFSEVQTFCRAYRSEKSPVRIVIIFGTPCTGKSSVTKLLDNKSWGLVNIDKIIAGIVPLVTRESFGAFSVEICHAMYKEVKENIKRNVFNVAIEAGCLFKKEEVVNLIDMLKLSGYNTEAWEFKISIDNAIKRAIERNRLIIAEKIDAVPIDDPNQIGVFYDAMEENRLDPLHLKTLNVDSMVNAEIFSLVFGSDAIA